jgi:hypothetical protein
VGVFDGYERAIVWEFDTNREFESVNDIPAKGASMIGAGPSSLVVWCT